ncbi:MAG: hypothetical protein E7480_08165 [Ruminococcaceae bacterium]|nr:hypothetical protein [Oscillospiraceae bacterium]
MGYKRPYTRRQSRRIRRFRKRTGSLMSIIIVLIAACIVALGFFTAKGVASLFSKRPSLPSTDTSSLVSDKNSQNSDTAVVDKELLGIYLPYNAIATSEAQSSALSFIKSSKINCVVIDLKAEDGVLRYQSSIQAVINSGMQNQATVDMQTLCKKFNEAGVHVIGRVVCFKDNLMPRTDVGREMSVKASDGSRRWDMYSWLNAYNSVACQYLYDIIKEACSLGFDEILLDEVKFPDSQFLAPLLYYGDASTLPSKNQALTDFINASCDIVHNASLKISLNVPVNAAYADIGNEISGQSFDYSQLKIDYLCPNFRTDYLSQLSDYSVVSQEIVINAEKNIADALKAFGKATSDKVSQQNSKIILRPWLRDYNSNTASYTHEQIQQQISALKETGYKNMVFFNTEGIYNQTAYN